MSGTETISNRLAIYIDLYNIEKGMEIYNSNGLILNYTTLIEQISEGYETVMIKVYDSTETDDKELYRLHSSLESEGYNMILKKPQTITENGKNRLVQKEVDTSIVADSICDAYMNLYDTCMIISGDRDFCPAVEKIKEIGKSVKVAGFDLSMATCLKDNCTDVLYIEDLMAFEAVPVTIGVSGKNYAKAIVAGGEICD